MHRGKPNPHFVTIEYVPGQNVSYSNKKTHVFPALNVSTNFATIGYDAHINTKIDCTSNDTPLYYSTRNKFPSYGM